MSLASLAGRSYRQGEEHGGAFCRRSVGGPFGNEFVGFVHGARVMGVMVYSGIGGYMGIYPYTKVDELASGVGVTGSVHGLIVAWLLCRMCIAA